MPLRTAPFACTGAALLPSAGWSGFDFNRLERAHLLGLAASLFGFGGHRVAFGSGVPVWSPNSAVPEYRPEFISKPQIQLMSIPPDCRVLCPHRSMITLCQRIRRSFSPVDTR